MKIKAKKVFENHQFILEQVAPLAKYFKNPSMRIILTVTIALGFLLILSLAGQSTADNPSVEQVAQGPGGAYMPPLELLEFIKGNAIYAGTSPWSGYFIKAFENNHFSLKFVREVIEPK